MHIGAETFDEMMALLPRKAYVLHSPPLGVFLGMIPMIQGRVGLWSRLPTPINFYSDHAVAFQTAADAHRFADLFDPPPEGLEFIEVTVSRVVEGCLFASRDECIAAGVQWWLDDSSEMVNTVPT